MPTQVFVPVEVFTATYRVAGEAAVTHTGLMGVLNNPTFSVMKLRHARLARLSAPTKLVATYRQLALTKRGIHVVAVRDLEYLGLMGGYSVTRTFRVWATSMVFEFEGDLAWTGHFDPKLILTAEEGRDFLPLTDALMRTVVLPTVRIQAVGLMVNRRKLDLFGLAEARVSSAGPKADAAPGGPHEAR